MPPRPRFSLAAAYRHLRAADPVVGALVDECGRYRPRPAMDHYESLLRTILFQQLAGPAARTILRRWLALHGDGPAGGPSGGEGRYPTPEEVLASADEAFRAAGVSRQKAGYMRDLAAHVLEGALDLSQLDSLADNEVMDRLVVVKGIGEWSAHMFLMFQLGRPDVLPHGDLGVRTGMGVAYGLAAPPTPAEARVIGERWAPYRSVGSWYMWRAAETGRGI
ncbi:MAG: DNA-3-methyladenine glycosylase 2 family protein [Dehalococcoidia bacterium]|nr:DNA-3-methyladenine glycosylase 2 family protein [Dehalococcoidia bacterium]